MKTDWWWGGGPMTWSISYCGNGIVEDQEQCDETYTPYCPRNVCSSKCTFIWSCSWKCGSHHKQYFDYETNPPANIQTGRCSQWVPSWLTYSSLTHKWTRSCLNYGLPASTENCVAYDLTWWNDDVLIKYICNKDGVLEKHQNQPGYPSDGACSDSMTQWQVCASNDANLEGKVCIKEEDPCITDNLIVWTNDPNIWVQWVVNSVTSLWNNTVAIDLNNDGWYYFKCPLTHNGSPLVRRWLDVYNHPSGWIKESEEISYSNGQWISNIDNQVLDVPSYDRLNSLTSLISSSVWFDHGKGYTEKMFCVYGNGVMCNYILPNPINSYCGDGVIQNWEQCDDGNQVDNDVCSNQCKMN